MLDFIDIVLVDDEIGVPAEGCGRCLAARRTNISSSIRSSTRSAIVTILRPRSFAKISRSGILAMVPSSFMISQITPLGFTPASLDRSTDPSVWPVRTRTLPLYGQ